MRKLFLIMTMALFALVVNAQEDENRGYIVKIGDNTPKFDLEMLDGTKLPIDKLKGKVVMLQFTASWCPVCIKEMPHIEKDIWQELKNNKEFALYGIDLREDKKKVEAFADRIGITYPLTMDEDGSIFSLFTSEGAGVTRNIVLDRDGKIIFLTRLFDEKEFDQMIDVIKKELAE